MMTKTVYPEVCRSACGQIDCTGCRHEPLLDAYYRARAEQINSGAVLTVSSSELDRIGPWLGNHIASIPNPNRTGILDAWRIGPVDAAEIAEFRQRHGITSRQ
jgi:hypothetical protein